MAFLGYDELKKVLEKNIEPYDVQLFEKTKTSYELTLGNEVYVTNSPNGKKEVLNESNNVVHIDPGQFALLLINEKITIPKDKLAFITLKFGVKVKGLINISGFHVDPGFSGKLIYSVYNAGTRTIILEMGKPYFSIWFSELSGNIPDGINPYNGKHQGQATIPSEYIENLQGRLWNPIELVNRINEIERAKKNNQWLLNILIGIAITLAVKLVIFDLSGLNYKKGYKDAINNEIVRKNLQEELNRINIDSLIETKVKPYFRNQIDSGKGK